MATIVIMPALGMAQETGKILQWFKQPGDRVEKGEPLLEIETDKATVELEAAAAGILSDVTAREGEDIPVGREIAKILTSEEANDANTAPVAAHTPSVAHPASVPAPAPQPVSERNTSSPARLTPASPKARRMLKERGIDPATVSGTGPGHAVIEADVKRIALPTPPSPTMQSLSVGTVWRLMADRTTQSWVTTPHFYLQREVNAVRLNAWRAAAQERFGVKISHTDLLLRLTSAALRQHPRLNTSWSNNTVVLNSEIHIGIAVAIKDGLVVPVIHNADRLSLGEIAARRQELIARARAGDLALGQLQGGTFTLSNLGMYDVDSFNAIINPPQAAILAVGRIADRIIPINGQPTVQPMLTLTLSCDHRVVDGAAAAEFSRTLANLIQEPLALLD